jgi:osmoprotectant transport system permease protein
MRLLDFILANKTEFAAALLRHILLVVVSIAVAVGAGVPLGILAFRRPRVGAPLIAFANVVQSIPSLALFGFLIPLPFIGGIGARSALVALILYALLPIIRTTVSGFSSIDPSIREAGVAMGMRPRELLRQVELPLAFPSILAGIRVAAVTGVGTATIAAAIGAGGLGEYIFRGVAMVSNTVILAGAVPAALLALIADLGLGWLERRFSPGRHRSRKRAIGFVAVALGLLAFLLVGWLYIDRLRSGVRIGSKNFTEQVILGEILAQAIERETGLRVERRLNLGGTLVCEQAMRAGDLDAYVEYTGTALTAIFKQEIIRDANEVNRRVAEAYAASGRTVGPALGFNNTFAILVRKADAQRLGLKRISDVAKVTPGWLAGFGPEFLDREDGYRGLARVYGLRFREPPRAMDLSLTYRALAERQVDLIAGDATNGLIEKLDLLMLEDDRNYFPPYHAVTVVRAEVMRDHPELEKVFSRLAGSIPDSEMRRMNYEADVEGRDVGEIAKRFLGSLYRL